MLPVPVLGHGTPFPPATSACENLVAVGGDLSVARMLAAYRGGIFPWSADPITWWSPDPRAVFEFDRIHVPRSLARRRRHAPFEFTLDRAFPAVIRACARAPRPAEKTWITPQIVEAYEALHRAGHAHSVECWNGNRLAGGLYGVAIGGFFAGESMFHAEPDASKLALLHLVGHLTTRGYRLFDTQMLTPTTRGLGAVEIPRTEYLRRLAAALAVDCRFA